MSRVLLLLPTTTYRTRDFVDAARRQGIETIVGSDQKQILEDFTEGKTITLDFSDVDRAARAITGLAADFPLQAIIATDETTAEIAAEAAARLGLPHNPRSAAHAARYKNDLRGTLRAAGIPTPEFMLVPADADPGSLDRPDYPVVLKPTFLSASRGVIRADDDAEFVAAFRRIKALLEQPEIAERGGDSARHILVESYVPGIELAVEGLLIDGTLKVLALFDKPEPLVGPIFEETLYITPSRLPRETTDAVSAAVADGARALGLVRGPVHAEVRINDDGIWIVELAARSIGGLCSRTLQFGTGLSLEEIILMQASGQPVADLERRPEPAGVMMIPVPARGTLTRVAGLDAASSIPGIEDVTISIPVGQAVEPLPEGSRYLGFIFARGDTVDDVESSLRRAFERLWFTIEPA